MPDFSGGYQNDRAAGGTGYGSSGLGGPGGGAGDGERRRGKQREVLAGHRYNLADPTLYGDLRNALTRLAKETKQTLGAAQGKKMTAITPLGGSMSKAAAPQLTSIFGVMGKEDLEETEKAFAQGEITVPENYSWDFNAGKPTGKSPTWEGTRGTGFIRDVISSLFGKSYDRVVTADRARTELAKGPGALARTTENLSEGNRQYVDGKLAPDAVGIGIDVARPVFDLVTGNLASAVGSGINAADTLRDLDTDFGASVSGQRARGAATAGTSSDSRLLFPSVTRAVTREKASTPTTTTAAVKRPRTGRSSLMLTGSRGVEDRANIFFTGLRKG